MTRWVGQIAHMGEMRNTFKILIRKLKGIDQSEDLGIDRKVIVEWMLEK
jgi:hypothetical protein